MVKEDKEKQKSSKGLIIFSVILLLIIITAALFFYIVIDEGLITINKNEDVIDIIKKNNKTKIKEEIITDSNLIVDLKNKVNYLNANKIYMNHIIPNLYKEEVSEKEAEEFTINKDNYNDFAIYKYKFFKDDINNYYFVSVEKVK